MNTLFNSLNIRDNFNWWLSELAGMLPNVDMRSNNNQHVFSVELNAKDYILQWREENNVVSSQSKFTSEEAASLFNKSIGRNKNLLVHSCDLRIASKLILKKEISLPIATEENIENVIAYEIDRYTPFKKDDVYYSVQIKERDKKEKKIIVLLRVIRKSLLDDVSKFAKDCELSIDDIYCLEEEGEEKISFVGFSGNQQHKKNKNSVGKFLLMLAIILSLVALIFPIGKNYWIGMQLEEQLNAKEGEITEVKQLLAEYKSIKGNVELVEQLSLNNIKVVRLLNDLTAIIPDDTSLNRFSLEEDVVRIQGLSSSASKLIPLLDSSEKFSEVRFAAPVTQNAETGKEKFTIEIRLQSSSQNNAAK